MPIIKNYGSRLGRLLWYRGQQSRTLQCTWGFLRWNTEEILLDHNEDFLLLLILRVAQVPTGPSTPHTWIQLMTALSDSETTFYQWLDLADVFWNSVTCPTCQPCWQVLFSLQDRFCSLCRALCQSSQPAVLWLQQRYTSGEPQVRRFPPQSYPFILLDKWIN